MIKYALHAGWIKSKTDGDEHYIGYGQLIKLYRLTPDEYCIWEYPYNFNRHWDDYIHLYPNYDGNYGRPNER